MKTPLATESRPTWRRWTIVGMKTVHSAIFLVNSVSVLIVFWTGVSGCRSRRTLRASPALAATLTESLVFVLNRGRCPLTGLVENLGAESGRVSDIFLQPWVADRNPFVFGPPLAIGVVVLALRSAVHCYQRGNTLADAMTDIA